MPGPTPPRLMLTVLGGLAEFERELINARTDEGRERAQARGVRFGRKNKLTPHQRQEALAQRAAGEALAEIGRSYNVSIRPSRGWAEDVQAPGSVAEFWVLASFFSAHYCDSWNLAPMDQAFVIALVFSLSLRKRQFSVALHHNNCCNALATGR